MHLKDKWITGLMNSFSLIDSTLIQQGFRRCGKEEQPTYQLTIQDSASYRSYSLKIPATVHLIQNVARLGKPNLSPIRHHASAEIPPSIRFAVESKLAEIADYLMSQR
ncbi:MAG TPA: hypothetical protein VJ824_08175 [Bacillota bacterium]|nr:hypothetical protein [Bacillota bacterium]